MPHQLNAGVLFPDLALSLVGDKSLRFPQDLEGRYRIALFYRGHW